MRILRSHRLGRLQIAVLLAGAVALSWIGGCGSGDPDNAPATWAQVTNNHTELDDASAANAVDSAAPMTATMVVVQMDASTGPVQTFRNPDGAASSCSTPNALCVEADGGPAMCVAIETDSNNCGACGNACIGTDATCSGGQCACSGVQEQYCDMLGCVNVGGDTNNCGSCGNVCDTGQICSGGTCQDNDDCCN